MFLDLALCGFALLEYLPSTVAISSILCAYGFLGFSAKGWLESIQDLSTEIQVYSVDVSSPFHFNKMREKNFDLGEYCWSSFLLFSYTLFIVVQCKIPLKARRALQRKFFCAVKLCALLVNFGFWKLFISDSVLC